MTPDASLPRQSAFLMFINCLAAPFACIVAMILSCFFTEFVLWRCISVAVTIPALVGYLWMKTLPESHQWLFAEKRQSSSQATSFTQLLDGIKILFNENYRRVTMCLLGAWFLMDIAYYGINFFVPYLLQTMELKSFSTAFSHQYHSILSNEAVWGTFIVNVFFMLGAFAAIFIVDKVNLINLQKYGFLFASLSLFLLALYFYSGFHFNFMIIFLFVMFNFAMNLGPDVTTYLLSATSYPVEIRGSGHGVIAGFAKFGSFLGVLLLPRLQDLWGYQMVILLLSILLFSAYILTINFSRVILKDRYPVEGNVAYETN